MPGATCAPIGCTTIRNTNNQAGPIRRSISVSLRKGQKRTIASATDGTEIPCHAHSTSRRRGESLPAAGEHGVGAGAAGAGGPDDRAGGGPGLPVGVTWAKERCRAVGDTRRALGQADSVSVTTTTTLQEIVAVDGKTCPHR